MARPLKYPQLAQLKNAGDEVTLPEWGRAMARNYAKRHNFPINITRIPGSSILVRRLEQAASPVAAA